MPTLFRVSSPRVRLPGLLAVCLVLAVAAPSSAQRSGVQSDPVDGSLRRSGSVIKNWVKRPSGGADAQQQYQDFFNNYYFPSMTQATPTGLGSLSKFRLDLFNQYLTKASPTIQSQLTEQAYAFAERVIRGKGPDGAARRYHRAVKYNAILILGDLGASYSREGARPLPKANDFLTRLATAPRLPAYMQAGALVGLGKHARAIDQLPAKNQQATVAALQKATAAGAIAAGADSDVKDWLRGRAAMALTDVAKKTGSAELTSVLMALVADESLSLDTRVRIAANFEGLPLNEASATAALALAAEVTREEVGEAEAFEEQRIGGRGRSSFSRGSGRGGGPSLIQSVRFRVNAETRQIEYIREALVARLTDLRKALAAVEPVAGENAEGVRTAIRAADLVMSLATSDEAIDLNLTQELKKAGVTILESAGEGSDTRPDAEDDAEDLF